MATKVKEPVAAAAVNATKHSANGSSPSSTSGKPLISNDKLKKLYQTMLECRLMEERARNLKKQARFKGNYYAAVGQEATAVGAAIDLRPEDTIAPSHRDFITGLIKGVPLEAMFSQLYGRTTSADKGRSAPAHAGYAPLNIITPASTIAAQLNIGTGVALANQMKKNDNVVVAFSGEGSTSLGFWHEALNFAGVRNLGIVYVCQNNLWAESVSVKLQTKVQDISVKAEAYGFPGITVDGNDVVAMYRVAQEAIERARNGGGPTLIEAKTYRWYGHSEIDPAKYRSAEEVEEWKAKDPIAAMERYLTDKGLFSSEWKQQITDEFTKKLDAAVEFAEKSPQPEPIECLDHLYSFDIRERELERKAYSPKF
jgi:pyruvate dehydrogenase E1 component alpha subunit